METLMQITGWIGTFLIVLAYFLVSHKEIKGTSKIYQLMNLFGAIAIGINVFHQQVWSSVVLQVAWGIIAIASLLKSKPAN